MITLNKGLLIAIEGIDGSGKSTLAHNLSIELHKKYATLLTKEPGASALGQKIRSLVHSGDIPICGQASYLLFAADRAQHFAELIIPELAKKKLIISDRLSDSSLAYQGYGNRLDMTMIETINRWVMKDIKPDLTIFINISVEQALKRVHARGAATPFEKKEFLERVAHGFSQIYQDRSDVIILNGMDTMASLTAQAYTHVNDFIQNKEKLNLSFFGYATVTDPIKNNSYCR